MTATLEFYRQEPILEIVGGADFDFSLTLTSVLSTTLDGRIGDLIRQGPINFTGWHSFKGEFTDPAETVRELVSVIVDGEPDEGTLRIRGGRNATRRMQVLGHRAGLLTILGTAPSGQLFTAAPCRWNLRVGSTRPDAPSVSDWTVLR